MVSFGNEVKLLSLASDKIANSVLLSWLKFRSTFECMFLIESFTIYHQNVKNPK